MKHKAKNLGVFRVKCLLLKRELTYLESPHQIPYMPREGIITSWTSSFTISSHGVILLVMPGCG
jgi:hypothetical protein